LISNGREGRDLMDDSDIDTDEIIRECLKCQGPTKVIRTEGTIEIEKCQNPDCGYEQAGIPGT